MKKLQPPGNWYLALKKMDPWKKYLSRTWKPFIRSIFQYFMFWSIAAPGKLVLLDFNRKGPHGTKSSNLNRSFFERNRSTPGPAIPSPYPNAIRTSQGHSLHLLASIALKTTAFRLHMFHSENGGTLGMVPLIINPIYILYSGYLLGISQFKGLLSGLNSSGTIPRVPESSLWMFRTQKKHRGFW